MLNWTCDGIVDEILSTDLMGGYVSSDVMFVVNFDGGRVLAVDEVLLIPKKESKAFSLSSRLMF